MTPPAVYLAGPEVFLPDAAAIGARKKALCEEHGLSGRFPGDVPAEEVTADNGRVLFARLVEMMDEADAVIANMTPFRGVSMDVGTAVEVGYMFARGRPVFGYTNVVGDYASRVAPDGMEVESFGWTDNLMCVAPTLDHGGVVVQEGVAEADRLRDLRGFEVCVRRAAATLLG